jgi:hypothetical protein
MSERGTELRTSTDSAKAQSQTVEKRKHPRVALMTEVALESIEKNSLIFGWIQDISAGGFKVKVNIPSVILKVFSLYVGDKVQFETYKDLPGLRGLGNIRWISDGGNRAGIKFDELDEDSRKNLEVFLIVSS